MADLPGWVSRKYCRCRRLLTTDPAAVIINLRKITKIGSSVKGNGKIKFIRRKLSRCISASKVCRPFRFQDSPGLGAKRRPYADEAGVEPAPMHARIHAFASVYHEQHRLREHPGPSPEPGMPPRSDTRINVVKSGLDGNIFFRCVPASEKTGTRCM